MWAFTTTRPTLVGAHAPMLATRSD